MKAKGNLAAIKDMKMIKLVKSQSLLEYLIVLTAIVLTGGVLMVSRYKPAVENSLETLQGQVNHNVNSDYLGEDLTEDWMAEVVFND